jgi:6-phosphofructokinase 2
MPPTYEPGGGGINVSRALRHLGCESLAMYFAGGYSGNFFQELVKNEDIHSLVIPIQGNTRTNIIVVEESTHQQYRFGMVSPPVEEQDWQLFLATLEKQSGYEYVIASGSLPAGVPLDFFGRVSAIVKKHDAKLIVDTSGDALKHAITEGVYMIKPNLNELSFLCGQVQLDKEEVVAAAKSIIKTKGCEVVAVSLGKEGAMLITANEYWHIVPPPIIPKSTVGAGDSMVAGIVYALSKGFGWEDVLRFGVSCGTAATMNEGTALCKKEDVDRLYQQLKAQVTVGI